MDLDILVFNINIILNFLDYIMYYYLCKNLIEQKTKLLAKIVFTGILYGVIIATLANVLDGYAAKIIVTAAMVLLVKFITKRRICDALIIFAIIYLCTTLLQALWLLVISILGLGMDENYSYLLVQILTAFVAFCIYIKIPLYKLYNKIEKEILLKLLIFSFAGIFLLMFCYFNFAYSPSYILYFSLLILLAFLGLCQTLKRIFFYTNKVPVQLHDMKNLLMGIYLSAYSTSDVHVVRKEIDRVLEIIDIDINIKNINMNDHNQNILSFINQKKSKSTKNELIFLTDIGYYESNAKVSFSVILYMLGVLLDNAIESGTKKVIIIKVSVIEESIYISVANEYKKKSVDDFNKMFEEKYSTKEETYSRGYGLSNLSKVVKSYGGNILLKEEYNKEQKCGYLKIFIDIRN